MRSEPIQARGRASRLLFSAVLTAILFAIPLNAAATEATVKGTLTATDGKPVGGARVQIVELRLSAFTDDDGSYRFESVPPGNYHIQAVSRGRGSAVREIEVVAGENRVDLALGISAHEETIVVTATGFGRGSADVVQPVNVLDEEKLAEKAQPTLGETLGKEPGVNSTYFGPGSSRPVIRGQEGSRVRVLEGGLGTGDASDTSPDHAVSVDPLAAERIEILRGPSTLLYGSSAVGGVVNVIDQRVPDKLPQNPVTGDVQARVGSAADERAGGANVVGRAGRFAFSGSGFVRKTDDYSIPGNALLFDPDDDHGDDHGDEDEHEEGSEGTLLNSDLETQRASLGFSYVWEGKGFLGASITGFQTNYGIPPGGHVHGDDHDDDHGDDHDDDHGDDHDDEHGHGEEDIRVDLEQRRFDLRGGLETDFGPFTGAQFSLTTNDYDHVELEGEEVGTRFDNQSWESRLELQNGKAGRLRGITGLQFGNRDFTATGEEAFVPPTDTDHLALFSYQELRTGKMGYEFGLRVEQQNVSAQGNPDRDFTGVSGSFGWLWRVTKPFAVAVSLSRTERLPNAEELYSDGPHAAVGIYQLGDPDLTDEIVVGGDLSLRKTTGRFTGELNLFFNRFDDYIYLEQQFDEDGDPIEVDELPLFAYQQGDSDFKGYELGLAYGLLHGGNHDLDIFFRSDQTQAELRDSGEALPRIPAQRFSVGLNYTGSKWYASIDVTRIEEQDDNAPTETATPDSTALNASVGRRFVGRDVVHNLLLRGTNLTDEDIRLHTSLLKNFAPLPGIDISLIYKLTF
jgi:iron complex outermembrane receptor protein